MHILLVEDNEGDIMLITEALVESTLIHRVSIARDGKEALDILDKADRYRSAERPDLVLLDINLPKKNGHEVLQYIKESDQLKHIPVIMLTTSSAQRDIDLSYRNHANCYITKPVEAGQLSDAVQSVERFWMTVAQLPSRNNEVC